MLELDKVERADFEACLGETFGLIASDGTLPLKLAEVCPLGTRAPNSSRDPFALRFVFTARIRVPQAIYRLEHERLGAMELFLVQIAGEPQPACLEAVFT